MNFLKLSLLLFFPISISALSSNIPSNVQSPLHHHHHEPHPQPPHLEIHIMSLCPDARYCFATLIHPALTRLSSLNIPTRFTLSTICRPDPKTDKITCPHGALECLGDVAHLCSLNIYPYPSTTHGIDFSKCLLDSYQLIPKEGFFRDCARTSGVEFEKLNACMSSYDPKEGWGLLRNSCERSERLGVGISCTVRVSWDDEDEMKAVCVRDAGVWKECRHKYGEDGKDVDFSELETLVEYLKEVWERRKGKAEGMRRKEVDDRGL